MTDFDFTSFSDCIECIEAVVAKRMRAPCASALAGGADGEVAMAMKCFGAIIRTHSAMLTKRHVQDALSHLPIMDPMRFTLTLSSALSECSPAMVVKDPRQSSSFFRAKGRL